MKTCSHCTLEKPFEAFYSSKSNKSGYTSWCKECESERNKAKTEKYKVNRLAKAKLWRDNNPDIAKQAIQNWRDKNRTRYAEYHKQYAKNNPDKVNAKWMKRYASIKQRTPSWLTEDDFWMIEQAYDIASVRTKMLGVPHHVDHIVPLQGKLVSGFHVPWNLQVITNKENWMKSNKINDQQAQTITAQSEAIASLSEAMASLTARLSVLENK